MAKLTNFLDRGPHNVPYYAKVFIYNVDKEDYTPIFHSDRRHKQPIAYRVHGYRCNLANTDKEYPIAICAFRSFAAMDEFRSRLSPRGTTAYIFERPSQEGHPNYDPNWIGRHSWPFGEDTFVTERMIYPKFDAECFDPTFTFWLGEAA